jgi:phosphopantothenoylcysteine decarboxylase/phosphopantothenate--cysteine ligase
VELANHLTDRGHAVTLLIGEQATYAGERRAARVRTFTTTASLRAELLGCSGQPVDAVFHAAAVSDFTFGSVWQRAPGGELTALQAGKLSTRAGALLAELIPTPKLILELRGWFPGARLAGWKYEVDGGRDEVLRAAHRQLAEARTDLCVVNGPAYGPGFGLVSAGAIRSVAEIPALYAELEQFVRR